MPQLDFFNILSQIEFGLFIFFFFYIFSVFFIIPTLLSIFSVRAFLKSFPLQLFNSYSVLINSAFSFVLFNFSEFVIEYSFAKDFYLEQLIFNDFLFTEFIKLEFQKNLYFCCTLEFF